MIMMSSKRSILLAIILSFIAAVHGRNVILDRRNTQIIDLAVRGEISTLVMKDLNRTIIAYETLGSSCSKLADNFARGCQGCKSQPNLKNAIQKLLNIGAIKAIQEIKRLSKQAGKFGKKVGEVILKATGNVLQTADKVFRHTGKAFKGALKGARDVMKGVSRTVRRFDGRVKIRERRIIPRNWLPRIRRLRIRIPRIRLPRIRLPRIRLPRIRLPRIRLPRIRLPRIRFRFRRWGKKKRRALGKQEIDDDIKTVLQRQEEKDFIRNKKATRDVTCSMCKMDEKSILKRVCGSTWTELDSLSTSLESLKQVTTSLETSAVVKRVSFDLFRVIYGQHGPMYTSVYITTTLGRYISTFKSYNGFRYGNELEMEILGTRIAREVYDRYKRYVGLTKGF